MITPLMPDVIAVEVPEGAKNFRLLDECSGKNVRGLFYEVGEERPWQVLPEGNWKYVYCTGKLTREQVGGIADEVYPNESNSKGLKQNYAILKKQ